MTADGRKRPAKPSCFGACPANLDRADRPVVVVLRQEWGGLVVKDPSPAVADRDDRGVTIAEQEHRRSTKGQGMVDLEDLLLGRGRGPGVSS